MNNERAIQEMLDKQAILDLLNAYCNAADRHDNVKMRSLYHADATDDHGSFFKGLAMEFIDKLPEIQKSMQILHHNMTTVNIKLDGDYGEGEVYILAFHQVATEQGPLDLLIGGRYFDTYAKREVWKFSSRAVSADWANLHQPSIVNLHNPIIEGAHIGKPGLDDPSYGMYKLFKFGEPDR
ncbi:MAG: nuclear transport factor 2 family protein [Gammaproteobacteria bacterium]|nr:nuclear transport factor 2 family protein [Gammaproteobacteria bacterium]